MPVVDGMLILFYHKYWDIVSPKVSIVYPQFLNGLAYISGINKIFISLIPKVKCPTKLTEYRSSSLYMIIYKIISKVITNRIKGLFHT